MITIWQNDYHLASHGLLGALSGTAVAGCNAAAV
jgi:hypothetical protein